MAPSTRSGQEEDDTRRRRSKKDKERDDTEGSGKKKSSSSSSSSRSKDERRRSKGTRDPSDAAEDTTGQNDTSTSGPNMTETTALSSHIPDQFPGQFPTTVATPYRPPLAASEGGPGLASDYYNDTGESVAEQPGNRIQSPSNPETVIVGAEPHLQPASSVEQPPVEPSASGQLGAAASFYDGSEEYQSTAGSASYQNASGTGSSAGKPSSAQHSSTSALGGAATGAAAGYVMSGALTSHANTTATATESASVTGQGSYYEASTTPSYPGPSSSGKPSSSGLSSSGLGLAAGAAAGAAALGATAYAHHQHQHPHQTPQQGHQSYSAGATAFRPQRRNSGPLGAVVDFFKDPEGVAQYEEYTEFIGVCRNCFEPGSSPRDAPRRHRFFKRRSKERLSDPKRVDKQNRYYSSDEEGRGPRNDATFMGAGIAGYGLAKVGQTLFNRRNDFDDNSEIKSGRYSPQGRRDSGARKASLRAGRDEFKGEYGVEDGGRKSKSRRSSELDGSVKDGSRSDKGKSRRRSRSAERKRKTDLATGMAVGGGIAAAGSALSSSPRRHSRSPKRRSSKKESEIRRTSPGRKKQRSKREKGFFSFLSPSSSSSSLDRDFSQSKRNRSTGKIKNDREAEAALLGLGAATAALAMHDRNGKTAPAPSEELIRRTYRPSGRDKMANSLSGSEDIWVSASEGETSSVESALAFGASSRRGSEDSGTDKWYWRWGGKGRARRESPPNEPPVVPANDAFIPSSEIRTLDSNGTPLQQVYPVPTSDPDRFDARHESNGQTVMVSRAETGQFAQPQPIAPVSSAFYTAATPDVSTKRSSGRELAEDAEPEFKLRRRATSPARIEESTITDSKRQVSTKDDASGVRFALSEEQDEKARKERRRRRREEREAEERAELKSKRRDSREGKDVSIPAAAGIAAGAAAIAGAAALASEGSKQEETREERRARRRREREMEDEEEAKARRERHEKKRARHEKEEAQAGANEDGSPSRKSFWQEAGVPKNVQYEDYQSFFAPSEVLGKPGDQDKVRSTDPNADVNLDQAASVIEIKPRPRRPDEPEWSIADTDDVIDLANLNLPWHVPALKLVLPTPPVSRVSTPLIEPKGETSSKDEGIKDEIESKEPSRSAETRAVTFDEPVPEDDEAPKVVRETKPSRRSASVEGDKGSYGNDIDFAAALAAGATAAGFDSSVVIDDPQYRRRESPPGSNGAVDEDVAGEERSKRRRKKDKKKARASETIAKDRDEKAIVDDIVNQVEQDPLVGSKDGGAEGLERELDATQVERTKELDDSTKAPAAETAQAVAESKARGRSLWARVLGKPVKGSEPNGVSEKTGDDPSREVPVTSDESRDENTKERKVESQVEIDSAAEAGPSSHRRGNVEPPGEADQAEVERPESFLDRRPEPPAPPDIQPLETSFSPSDKAPSTPKGHQRRSSDMESWATASPTAVPVYFKRPVSWLGQRRSSSQSPLSSEPAISESRPKPKQRPKSIEFRSNEMRPLFLVERHQSHYESPTNETYPPLPASRDTSPASSVRDLGEGPQNFDDEALVDRDGPQAQDHSNFVPADLEPDEANLSNELASTVKFDEGSSVPEQDQLISTRDFAEERFAAQEDQREVSPKGTVFQEPGLVEETREVGEDVPANQASTSISEPDRLGTQDPEESFKSDKKSKSKKDKKKKQAMSFTDFYKQDEPEVAIGNTAPGEVAVVEPASPKVVEAEPSLVDQDEPIVLPAKEVDDHGNDIVDGGRALPKAAEVELAEFQEKDEPTVVPKAQEDAPWLEFATTTSKKAKKKAKKAQKIAFFTDTDSELVNTQLDQQPREVSRGDGLIQDDPFNEEPVLSEVTTDPELVKEVLEEPGETVIDPEPLKEVSEETGEADFAKPALSKKDKKKEKKAKKQKALDLFDDAVDDNSPKAEAAQDQVVNSNDPPKLEDVDVPVGGPTAVVEPDATMTDEAADELFPVSSKGKKKKQKKTLPQLEHSMINDSPKDVINEDQIDPAIDPPKLDDVDIPAVEPTAVIQPGATVADEAADDLFPVLSKGKKKKQKKKSKFVPFEDNDEPDPVKAEDTEPLVVKTVEELSSDEPTLPKAIDQEITKSPEVVNVVEEATPLHDEAPIAPDIVVLDKDIDFETPVDSNREQSRSDAKKSKKKDKKDKNRNQSLQAATLLSDDAPQKNAEAPEDFTELEIRDVPQDLSAETHEENPVDQEPLEDSFAAPLSKKDKKKAKKAKKARAVETSWDDEPASTEQPQEVADTIDASFDEKSDGVGLEHELATEGDTPSRSRHLDSVHDKHAEKALEHFKLESENDLKQEVSHKSRVDESLLDTTVDHPDALGSKAATPPEAGVPHLEKAVLGEIDERVLTPGDHAEQALDHADKTSSRRDIVEPSHDLLLDDQRPETASQWNISGDHSIFVDAHENLQAEEAEDHDTATPRDVESMPNHGEGILPVDEISEARLADQVVEPEEIPHVEVTARDSTSPRKADKKGKKKGKKSVRIEDQNLENGRDLPQDENLSQEAPIIETPASAASLDLLDAQEQREYDKEYARELERQLRDSTVPASSEDLTYQPPSEVGKLVDDEDQEPLVDTNLSEERSARNDILHEPVEAEVVEPKDAPEAMEADEADFQLPKKSKKSKKKTSKAIEDPFAWEDEMDKNQDQQDVHEEAAPLEERHAEHQTEADEGELRRDVSSQFDDLDQERDKERSDAFAGTAAAAATLGAAALVAASAEKKSKKDRKKEKKSKQAKLMSSGSDQERADSKIPIERGDGSDREFDTVQETSDRPLDPLVDDIEENAPTDQKESMHDEQATSAEEPHRHRESKDYFNTTHEIFDSYEGEPKELRRAYTERSFIDSYNDDEDLGEAPVASEAQEDLPRIPRDRHHRDSTDKKSKRLSTTSSNKVYDSDDSNDSGYDVQKRRRRQSDQGRKLSTVSSTTKDRSSALFDSSPSGRDPPATHIHELEDEPESETLDSMTHDRKLSDDPIAARAGSTWSFSNLDKEPTERPSIFGDGTGVKNIPESASKNFMYGEKDIEEPKGVFSADESDGAQSPLERKSRRQRSRAERETDTLKARKIRTDDRAQETMSEEGLPLEEASAISERRKSSLLDRRSSSRSTDRRSSRLSQISSRGLGILPQDLRSSGVASSESIHAIIRTPDNVRSASGQSFRSSGTPPLRRKDHSIGSDLRSGSKLSGAKSGAISDISEVAGTNFEPDLASVASSSKYDPVRDKGKGVREGSMADYEGWGDHPGQSPISPSRPASMRKRQSMHFADMEQRVAMLASENGLLQSAKTKAERRLEEQARDHSEERRTLTDAVQEHKSYISEKDATLSDLYTSLDSLREQVAELKEANEELRLSPEGHTTDTVRELEELRLQHSRLAQDHEEILSREVEAVQEEKDAEIQQLQEELEDAQEQIRRLQQQLLESRSTEDLVEHDEDYFESKCQDLFKHLSSWVTRFSKLSDNKRSFLAAEMRNDAHRDQFEDSMLDGAEVDDYLQDRHKRRDVFLSVTMSLMFQHIFARYLFGMDREHRQKLKVLDKTLQEVGPPSAVHKWRATTLSLLSQRPTFQSQREADSEAVVDDVWSTLSTALPPPSNSTQTTQCHESLRRIVNLAVDLSIDMRLQKAEYSMLPPPEPDFDPQTGDVRAKLPFAAAKMDERSGISVSKEDLEDQEAYLRLVLFPLVVKNTEDDTVVVYPAQVHVAPLPKKGGKTVRVMSVQGSTMSVQGARSEDGVSESFADDEEADVTPRRDGGMF